ncbi:MAG: peptidase C39 family protein [Nitrospiraceae bacterium]|nr:MAG: peptidase C39 family protein [Nitrospiraceae bacterium]
MRLKFQSVNKQAWIIPMPAYLFLAILAFVLHSCGTASVLRDPKQQRVIANVPFYAQEDYQCGPASLAGVMNYWKIDVTPEDIAKEIYSKSAKGTLNIDMVIYPQKKGLLAEQYSGNIQDLKKNIDSGYPLLVFVDYGFWVYESGHFMVVVGYNEDGVIVNSGKDKGKFISEEDFLKTWEKTKFWTLLIRKK